MSTQQAPVAVSDEQSFEEFFADVWPWAFRLASFLAQDTAAGEDIAQDVLNTMSQRWGTAERPAAPATRRSTLSPEIRPAP